jgi:putative flippase GtrA
MIDRVFARFLIVGIGNTVLGLAVIFAARQLCTEVVANLIGYLFVVPVSFLTHRNVSFRDKGGCAATFARYIPAIALGYLANLGVLTLALNMGVNGYLAQTAAIASHVIVTYLLSRFFVFLTPHRENHGTATATNH